MRIIIRLFFVGILTFFMFSLTLEAQNKPKRKILMPPELKEVSGFVVVKNEKVPTLLLHNDGGNDPFLYKTKGNKVINTIKFPKNIINNDWEDLTQDDKGNIYIGDFGNNLNSRKDLKIYRYNAALNQIDSITFTYPDQNLFPPTSQKDWNFDCEAMVYCNDSLHLFTKNRFVGNFYTKHYILTAKPGNYIALFRDSILLKNQVVTGAALSNDGKTLALITYYFKLKNKFWPVSRTAIWFLKDYKNTNFFKGRLKKQKVRKLIIGRQIESVAHFDGPFWLIGNEKMKFNKASIRSFRER
jgi:hypothetical protein